MSLVRKQELTKARIEQGLSMLELAKMTGLSPSSISRIERGGSTGAKSGKKIAMALGREIFDIFELRD
jgi:excisionase family DNA binding protein